jgi:enoyl-CoA hydratase/carnithine racemase
MDAIRIEQTPEGNMGTDLLYEVKGQTAWMTINRESRRNAISQGVMIEMMERLEQIEKDSEVRAICFTGVGDKIFCSGADLGSNFFGESNVIESAHNYALLLKKLSRTPKPIVARVNGPCLAGGLGFMLSCDIVIARNDAWFSTPEVNVGIWPMMVGALLYRNLSRKKAIEMVLTARRVSAAEAEQIGLITMAVPPDKLDAKVNEVLDGLVQKSPIGLAIGKRAFYKMADLPFEDALDYLADQLIAISKTEDAAEGIAAFAEKRKPLYKGK